MRVKHILHRSFEEIKATLFIAKNTSLKKALITFRAKLIIQKLNRNGFKESDKDKKYLLKKHEIMLDFFQKKYQTYIDQYNIIKEEDGDINYDDTIWICWWQGIENAPELVKACVNSIKMHAGTHPVVFITDENVSKYVQIPNFLLKKIREGTISKTHYSDYVRTALLAKYGGLWLDSTFLCNSDKLSTCFNENIWSIKRPDYLHCSVFGGYFANYSMRVKYGYRWIYKIVRDFWTKYWIDSSINGNILIDYLLYDYLFTLIIKNFENVKNEVCKIQPNNPMCDALITMINDNYDELTWKVLNKDTFLFKLSWKAKVDHKKSATFYDFIIEKYLN